MKGNTSLAEPNLKVLSLRYFGKALVSFLFVKMFFKTMMYYQMTKNNAVNRNLTHVTNN